MAVPKGGKENPSVEHSSSSDRYSSEFLFDVPELKIHVKRIGKKITAHKIFNRLFKPHHYMQGSLAVSNSVYWLAREAGRFSFEFGVLVGEGGW